MPPAPTRHLIMDAGTGLERALERHMCIIMKELKSPTQGTHKSAHPDVYGLTIAPCSYPANTGSCGIEKEQKYARNMLDTFSL